MSTKAYWWQRNFALCDELGVAGEFLFDGIEKLNTLNALDRSPSLFTFLYYVSVGIERLQKIIILLESEVVTQEDVDELEKSLITHSHSELQNRIVGVQLNSRENAFLNLLTKYYKSARYHRFNLSQSNFELDLALISDFAEKHLEVSLTQQSFLGANLISAQAKELLGRIVGSIAKKILQGNRGSMS